jgi:hypothetical protein
MFSMNHLRDCSHFFIVSQSSGRRCLGFISLEKAKEMLVSELENDPDASLWEGKEGEGFFLII